MQPPPWHAGTSFAPAPAYSPEPGPRGPADRVGDVSGRIPSVVVPAGMKQPRTRSIASLHLDPADTHTSFSGFPRRPRPA